MMEIDSTRAGNELHFKNPPIIEAVIAFSFLSFPPSILDGFRACADKMKAAGYIHFDPLKRHSFQLKVEGDNSSFQASDGLYGFKFLSEDRLYAAQFNQDSFVFSRLGHYDRWESFREEAKRIWEIYSAAAGRPNPIGVDVRYINKLFIPEGADSDDYVRLSPRLPVSLLRPISEMFMRIALPIEKPEGKFIHTQTLLPREREEFTTLLLDNDFQFPVSGMSTDQVWEMLESIRNIKDQYFLELTTNKMRETFNA